jgi:hypothetical protein
VLARSSDAALAGDATFLLARTLTRPRDRADVLDRYVARGAPSPYREQATLERAEALLADGDRDGARRLAAELAASTSLPSPTRKRLDALRATLGAR